MNGIGFNAALGKVANSIFPPRPDAQQPLCFQRTLEFLEPDFRTSIRSRRSTADSWLLLAMILANTEVRLDLLQDSHNLDPFRMDTRAGAEQVVGLEEFLRNHSMDRGSESKVDRSANEPYDSLVQVVCTSTNLSPNLRNGRRPYADSFEFLGPSPNGNHQRRHDKVETQAAENIEDVVAIAPNPRRPSPCREFGKPTRQQRKLTATRSSSDKVGSLDFASLP